MISRSPGESPSFRSRLLDWSLKFHDADFPFVVVPLMFVMMLGMGAMMWYMVQMMMGTGAHGASHRTEEPGDTRVTGMT